MSDENDDEKVIPFPSGFDPLGDALGVPPIEEGPLVVKLPETDKEYQFARENIATGIGKLGHSIDELMRIAKDSQHPRAFEVLSGMMKTYFDANKDMLDLKKKEQELTGGGTGAQIVNNNLILTSEEVLRMVKQTKD